MLVAAGAAFAAVNVAVYALLDAVAPEGAGAEALTWLTTAGAAATAAGAALAGALAGAGDVGGARLPAVGAALARCVVGGGCGAGRRRCWVGRRECRPGGPSAAPQRRPCEAPMWGLIGTSSRAPRRRLARAP